MKEGDDVRIAAQEASDVGRRLVSTSKPYHFGWWPKNHGHFRKVRIEGNEREISCARGIPDGLVICTVQTDQNSLRRVG